MEMNVNDISVYYFQSGKLSRICALYMSRPSPELISEILYVILTYKHPARIVEMHRKGELDRWLSRVVRNQVYNGNYYRTYKVYHLRTCQLYDGLRCKDRDSI